MGCYGYNLIQSWRDRYDQMSLFVWNTHSRLCRIDLLPVSDGEGQRDDHRRHGSRPHFYRRRTYPVVPRQSQYHGRARDVQRRGRRRWPLVQRHGLPAPHRKLQLANRLRTVELRRPGHGDVEQHVTGPADFFRRSTYDCDRDNSFPILQHWYLYGEPPRISSWLVERE